MIKTVLGFTGTRKGMTRAQVISVFEIFKGYEGDFHYGDCTGSDYEAACLIDLLGSFVLYCHPPILDKYRAYFQTVKSEHHEFPKKPYADRDYDIVKVAKRLVATPAQEREVQRGSGTWLTVRMARAEGIPISIVLPDGNVKYEGGY